MGLPDNEVTMTFTGWLSLDFSYLADSFTITAGESSSLPPKVSPLGRECKVSVACGRKGSADMASQFLQTCGGRNHVFSPSSWSVVPEKLNFFFGLTATFTDPEDSTGTQVIYLAQGHMGVRNNWWIGGPCVVSTKNITSTGLLVAPTEKELSIYAVSGGVSNIEMSIWRN